MILNDKRINNLTINDDMISPYTNMSVKTDPNGKPIVSYGLSSFGYDVRCSDEFLVFNNLNAVVIDPKKFDERSFVQAKLHEDKSGQYCIVPDN